MSTEELLRRKDEVGIGGPIALLSVGGGLLILGTAAALSGASANQTCSGCGSTAVGVGVVAGILGAGMAVGGGVWLGSRLGERGEYDDEIEYRNSEPGAFAPRWQVGTMALPGGLGLGLGGDF